MRYFALSQWLLMMMMMMMMMTEILEVSCTMWLAPDEEK